MAKKKKNVSDYTKTDASTIVSVEACTVRVPLDQVTSFATRTVQARDYALVRIRTNDGVEGIGFCYAGSTAGRIVTTAVRELFAPVLIGHDSHAVERLWQNMYREGILQGRAGSLHRSQSKSFPV